MKYSLEEEEYEGFFASWSNQEGTITTSGILVTALNTAEIEDTGVLTVVKEAPVAAVSESFDFVVSFTDSEGNLMIGDINYSYSNTAEVKTVALVDGQMSFALNPGRSISSTW